MGSINKISCLDNWNHNVCGIFTFISANIKQLVKVNDECILGVDFYFTFKIDNYILSIVSRKIEWLAWLYIKPQIRLE